MKELQEIQTNLKATKDKYNSFAKFYYRSCESILESVKPLLAEHKCTVNLSDSLVEAGGRLFVEATATITNEDGYAVSAKGYAELEKEKKGMDASQLTGSASSYARKYALNGLFAIDDNKDADTDEYHTQATGSKTETKKSEPKKAPAKKEQAPAQLPDETGLSMRDIAMINTFNADGKVTEELLVMVSEVKCKNDMNSLLAMISVERKEADGKSPKDEQLKNAILARWKVLQA